jgi:ABC-type Na+ efflux pump permease subunit
MAQGMQGMESLKAASTLTGQLITVSSGLLAFTVTFVEKFTPKNTEIMAPLPLKISWVCFAVSIVLGFWTLMAVTGTLENIDRGTPESNPKRRNIRIPAMLMVVAFFLGVVFLIAAGWTIAGN